MKKTDPPIIVEQVFYLPKEKVWAAITEHEQMVQWFFDNVDSFQPEIGFYTKFVTKVEDRKYTHQWKITDVVPGEKITYHWSYQEYPEAAGQVDFELTEQDGKTTLRLTNTILEDFPENIPEFNRQACIGGWEYFIRQQLKDYLGDQ